MVPLKGYFQDSEHHLKRLRVPFRAPPKKLTKPQIERLLPQPIRETLYSKSTWLGILYTFRASFFIITFYALGSSIPNFLVFLRQSFPKAFPGDGSATFRAVQFLLCSVYVVLQSLAFAAFWTLAHEAGHMTLSPHKWVNHVLGYVMHTFLLTPYFSWRATHMTHHKKTSNIEDDENWVPEVRAACDTPRFVPGITSSRATSAGTATCNKVAFIHEMVEETPIFAVLSMIKATVSTINIFIRICVQQLLGWQLYVLFNAAGSPKYPPGTNHLQPSSPLFKPTQQPYIFATNIGLIVMASILGFFFRSKGIGAFVIHYFLPYLICNHWIVLLTFLHHTDPSLPHYRAEEWTFVRGALATVDRPLLGWAGRVFLHSVSHDHIAHHLFVGVPFWKLEPVTEALKQVLKEGVILSAVGQEVGDTVKQEEVDSVSIEDQHSSQRSTPKDGYSFYNYDNTGWMRSLWRSFTQCVYIDKADLLSSEAVFYRNAKGKLLRPVERRRKQ